VVDPASIAASRRRRRAKTDRIDGEALVRALLAYKRGEPRVCAMVRAPSPESEDSRRLSRERKTLTVERVQRVNRIKGLLFSQGVSGYEPLRRNRRQRLTYFHSATSSFRASATMVVFLRRPPLWLTRSLNHRASADCGWCRSHSQASWIIVVRSRGLPALDTPCSCATDPLCQGVGASPAYAPSCFRLVKLRHSPSDERTATNSAPMPFRSANIACGAGSSGTVP
jgi:hypothetical protein